MCSTINPTDRATLEARYLVALMRRDARIFAERCCARDHLMAREPVRQISDHNKTPVESLSIFEDSFVVLVS